MILSPELSAHFQGEEGFNRILELDGQVFRSLEGRKTLRFSLDGKSYFAKLHFGIGWKEIFKNLFNLKKPVLSAENEWRALGRLEQLGIPSMKVVGFGRRHWNPARLQSFLITEELQNTISLEELGRRWADDPPPFALKKELIQRVAGMARLLHENGLNHRDFYLCHFLMEMGPPAEPLGASRIKLYLIDLHRAQVRRRTPRRWIIKDLAGLFFSSLEIGLTQRDLLRFVAVYRNRPLRRIMQEEARFWSAVTRQAGALYQKIRRRRLPAPFPKVNTHA